MVITDGLAVGTAVGTTNDDETTGLGKRVNKHKVNYDGSLVTRVSKTHNEVGDEELTDETLRENVDEMTGLQADI